MSTLRITEALPEGEHAAWVTLDDGLTRLIDLRPLSQLSTHHSLRLPSLVRSLRVTEDARHIYWPGGAHLDITSIALAPAGPLPVGLLALLPSARRYRPLAPLLSHQPVHTHSYLDVRPEQVLQDQLRIKPADLQQFLRSHAPVEPGLCIARLSDLYLALQLLLPVNLIPALLRRPWPAAIRHAAQGTTALDCLWKGRIDLIDTPLTHLLLPDAPPVSVLLSSDAEANGAATAEQQQRPPEGQRDR